MPPRCRSRRGPSGGNSRLHRPTRLPPVVGGPAPTAPPLSGWVSADYSESCVQGHLAPTLSLALSYTQIRRRPLPACAARDEREVATNYTGGHQRRLV